jgi:hypothetical protein
MSPATTVLTSFREALAQLRDTAYALRNQYGDSSALQRIINDLDRLDIDTGELSAIARARPEADSAGEVETIIVPDTPYDPSLWLGADDEGVGGQARH